MSLQHKPFEPTLFLDNQELCYNAAHSGLLRSTSGGSAGETTGEIRAEPKFETEQR